MKVIQNRLLIEVTEQYNELYAFNGGTLYAPQDFGWKKRRICFGIVKVIPEKMSDTQMLLDNYYGHNHTDIANTVQIGDKVYFYGHYNDPSNWLHIPELLSNPDNEILNLEYEAVICTVRENKIQMVGSHLLLSPITESEESIRTAAGIFTKPNVESKELEAIVANIGSPLCRYAHFLWSAELHDYVVQVGDKVLITTDADFTMEIEGNNYYVCRQTDIVAVFVSIPETDSFLDTFILSEEVEILPFGYHCLVEVLNGTNGFKNGILLTAKQFIKQDGLLVRVIEASEHCEVAETGKIYRAVDKLIKIQDLCFIQEQFLQYEIL